MADPLGHVYVDISATFGGNEPFSLGKVAVPLSRWSTNNYDNTLKIEMGEVLDAVKEMFNQITNPPKEDV